MSSQIVIYRQYLIDHGCIFRYSGLSAYFQGMPEGRLLFSLISHSLSFLFFVCLSLFFSSPALSLSLCVCVCALSVNEQTLRQHLIQTMKGTRVVALLPKPESPTQLAQWEEHKNVILKTNVKHMRWKISLSNQKLADQRWRSLGGLPEFVRASVTPFARTGTLKIHDWHLFFGLNSHFDLL